MRRVVLLVSVVLVLSATGCAKYRARRFAPAYYESAPCGCDGAAGPMDGVIVPGPGPAPIGVSPQAAGPVIGPIGRSITSTPIQGAPAAF